VLIREMPEWPSESYALSRKSRIEKNEKTCYWSGNMKIIHLIQVD
jgi:hypothetical protein